MPFIWVGKNVLEPTVAETQSQTVANSTTGVQTKETVDGVVLTLGGATLQISDEKTFEKVIEDWFDAYYNGKKKRRQRMLQQGNVQGMTSKVTVTNQALDSDGVLQVTYSHEMDYTRFDDVSAHDLAWAPYQDTQANQELIQKLQDNVAGLEALSGPILISDSSKPKNPVADLVGSATKDISTVAVIGIVIGIIAVLVFCGILTGCCLCRRRRQTKVPNHSTTSSTGSPTQYVGNSNGNTSNASPTSDVIVARPQRDGDDVSTMEGDSAIFASSPSIWDVATVANTTVNRPITDDNFVMNFQPRDNEHVFLVDAPQGPLGLIIDKDEEWGGPPFVATVKSSSVLKENVMVGDRLVGLDGKDVRSLSVAEVSYLILDKNDNSIRQLVLVRDKDF
jgi:hypothetical protein